VSFQLFIFSLPQRKIWISQQLFVSLFSQAHKSEMSTNHNAIHSTTSYEKIASACSGAILTSILVTPMDVVKMRLQTQAMNAAAAQNYKTAKSFSSVCCMPADLKKVAGEVCKWNTIPRHERKRLSPSKLRAAAMHECSHGVLRLDAASRAARPSGGLLVSGRKGRV
jgi:hypothetical protein